MRYQARTALAFAPVNRATSYLPPSCWMIVRACVMQAMMLSILADGKPKVCGERLHAFAVVYGHD